DDERGIEVGEVARADDDRGAERERPEGGDGAGTHAVARPHELRRQDERALALGAQEGAAGELPQRRGGRPRAAGTRPHPARGRRRPATSRAGKAPPTPPIAPPSPPTMPVLPGKRSATSLNAAPLPPPSSDAVHSAPTVNGTIDDQASSSAKGTMPRKTPAST